MKKKVSVINDAGGDMINRNRVRNLVFYLSNLIPRTGINFWRTTGLTFRPINEWADREKLAIADRSNQKRTEPTRVGRSRRVASGRRRLIDLPITSLGLLFLQAPKVSGNIIQRHSRNRLGPHLALPVGDDTLEVGIA